MSAYSWPVAFGRATSFRRRAGVVRQVLAVPNERRLIVRMVFWRMLVTTLKHAVPIRRVVALAGNAPRGSAPGLPPQERIVELAALVCRPRLLRTSDNCLDRTLVAYRYLLAAGASPSVVIGLGRAEDVVHGHAWLMLDGRALGEGHETLADFTELVRFAADGSIERSES